MYRLTGALQRRPVVGLAVLLGASILLGAGPPSAGLMPSALTLGSAAPFAVLAGGGVTDTGPSHIAGDVGTHPLPAVSDLVEREATGAVHRADAISSEAQRDVAATLAATTDLRASGTVALAGKATIGPGIYTVVDGASGVATALTLDGHDAASPVWIFLVPRNLVTAPGGAIELTNAAQASNVFWLVRGSASLGAGSAFAGTILASTSVMVGRSVTIDGRLLARSGAVTLAGDTITLPTTSSSQPRAAVAPAATAPAPATASRSAIAGSTTALPSYLPIVMLGLLIASVVLAEPRHKRRPRPSQYRW